MKKNHCLVILLLFTSFFLFSYTSATAQSNTQPNTQSTAQPAPKNITINKDFIRTFIQAHAYTGKAGYDEAMAFIKSCNSAQLELLKSSIEEYKETREEIFIPLLETNFIDTVAYTIDDRLGIFSYDKVIEGKFTCLKNMGGLFDYYILKTTSGKSVTVYRPYTFLRPYYEYLENYNDDVRLYVQKKRDPDGFDYWYVVKIELLADNNPPITPTVKRKEPVNDEFAREVMKNAIRDNAKGRRFVRNALNSLDRNGLLLLRKIIFNDMEYSVSLGKIVPPTPVPAQNIGYRVVYLIDERLGIPRYDLTLEGRFVKLLYTTPPNNSIVGYLFQPVEGEALTVRLESNAIVPLGYKVSFNEDIRIFIVSPYNFIIKIERLDGTGY